MILEVADLRKILKLNWVSVRNGDATESLLIDGTTYIVSCLRRGVYLNN